MKVLLKRPIFTAVGMYSPDPDGVVIPDSLADKLPKDAEVLEGPDEAKPVEDPDMDPSRGTFVAHMDASKPQAKRSTKAKASTKKTILDKD